MSKITLVSPISGTAEFSITTPSGTSTDRTVGLPDASGELYIAGTPLSASTGEFTGAVSIGAGWTLEQSGTDLLFKYSGTSVFKITSAGAIVAKDNVTAYGTV
jgi:hypothetical protein